MGKLNLSSALQESLLGLICFDAKEGKTARGMLTPASFSPYFRQIAEQADIYWDTYKKNPGEHTLDIIEALKLKEPDSASNYDQIYYSLNVNKDRINKEYILSKATLFARAQNVKAILTKALGSLARDDETGVNEAEALMAGAGKTSYKTDTRGTLLNDPDDAFRFLEVKEDNHCPMGIPEFDKLGIGPTRKKYMLTAAETGTGKSFEAVHIGKMGLIHGWRVVHITCEMDEPEVSQRYVQTICSVGERDGKTVVSKLKKDEKGRIINISSLELKRKNLKQSDIRQHLLKKWKGLKNRPKLFIKEYPSGSLTIRQLEAYLDYLEAIEGFAADLIIIDYPALMSVDSKNPRESYSKITVDLRGLASKRNAAVVGFSQVVGKGSKGEKVIRTGRSFGDRTQEHTADIMFTLNQTDAEYELGLMRMAVVKVRGQRKGIQVLLSQCFHLGQFCLNSALFSDSYWSMVDSNGDHDE